MSNNQKPGEINLFSPLGITISLILIIPIFTVNILVLHFPETWKSIIVNLGIVNAFSNSTNTAEQKQAVTSNQPQTKTIELSQVLNTPAGAIPVTKYSNDNCLYVKATTAQISHFGTDDLNGTENLKNQLKILYKVNCILFD